MKNTLYWLGILILFSFLLVIIIYFNLQDIKRDEFIRNQQIENDSLKQEIVELKKFEKYGISIGDSTLHVVTSLKIQNEPYKYLHVKRIKLGKNRFYLVLNEKTAIDLIVMKYK